MNEAQRIFGHLPGVGSAVAGDLFVMGYRSAKDLASEDPSLMYERLCTLQGCRVDRCMLYVFRCCVHVTRTGDTHWQWWDFKDGGAAGL